MRVVEAGTLEQVPLPRLLVSLYEQRHGGAVEFQFDEGGLAGTAAQLFLRGGYPAEVLLQSGAERLGGVLLEAGLIDRDRYLRAQALRPTAGKRIGTLMMGARLLDRRTLGEGLRAQQRRRLHLLFYPPRGRFQILAGQHDRGSAEGEALRVDPRRAVYFGVRRVLSEAQLQQGLRDLKDQEVRLAAAEAAEAARWLPAEEQRLCQLLGRGYFTLPDLQSQSRLPAPCVLAFVYTYLLFGLLDQRPISGAPNRREVPAGGPVPVAPSYQGGDELIPPKQSPLASIGRAVHLHAGEGVPETLAGAAGQPRLVPLVPLLPSAKDDPQSAATATAPLYNDSDGSATG